jgi:hypothetical protein
VAPLRQPVRMYGRHFSSRLAWLADWISLGDCDYPRGFALEL